MEKTTYKMGRVAVVDGIAGKVDKNTPGETENDFLVKFPDGKEEWYQRTDGSTVEGKNCVLQDPKHFTLFTSVKVAALLEENK